jgi:hypothetical protein
LIGIFCLSFTRGFVVQVLLDDCKSVRIAKLKEEIFSISSREKKRLSNGQVGREKGEAENS